MTLTKEAEKILLQEGKIASIIVKQLKQVGVGLSETEVLTKRMEIFSKSEEKIVEPPVTVIEETEIKRVRSMWFTLTKGLSDFINGRKKVRELRVAIKKAEADNRNKDKSISELIDKKEQYTVKIEALEQQLNEVNDKLSILLEEKKLLKDRVQVLSQEPDHSKIRMTEEEATSAVIKYGKHYGERYVEVFRNDHGYFDKYIYKSSLQGLKIANTLKRMQKDGLFKDTLNKEEWKNGRKY